MRPNPSTVAALSSPLQHKGASTIQPGWVDSISSKKKKDHGWTLKKQKTSLLDISSCFSVAQKKKVPAFLSRRFNSTVSDMQVSQFLQKTSLHYIPSSRTAIPFHDGMIKQYTHKQSNSEPVSHYLKMMETKRR